MPFDLRPLSIPELLDRSFTMYRRHFVLFVGIMAAPHVIGLMFSLPMNILQYAGPPPDALVRADPLAIATMVFGFLLVFLIFWVVYMVALGATAAGVAALYRGRPATIGSAYADVWQHAGPLFLLTLHIAVRLFGVFALLFGGGVALSTAGAALAGPIAALIMLFALPACGLVIGFMVMRYSLSVPALVLEDVGALAAIRRSIFLTRGHMGRVFLVLLCATVITYASVLLFQGPFLIAAMLAGPDSVVALWLTIAGTTIGTVGTMITAPIMIIGLAVLYFDTRVRREALDLQIMLGALDGPGTPSMAAAPSTSL